MSVAHSGWSPLKPSSSIAVLPRRRPIALTVALLLLLVGLVPSVSRADVLGIGSPTTYKEYWVPHSQFTGGCLGDQKSAGSFYIEPGWLPDYPAGYSCVKTVTLSIPDNVSGAAKAEIYLDLWRAGRDTTDLARFQINGGTVRRTYRGADWSRTPFIGEIPLSELRQGDNTLTFSSSSGAYHIHDVMVRVTTDATHPIAGPGDLTPPTGALTSIAAGGRSYDPAAGGTLNVDDDTVTLTATAAGAARVEFHASYAGYDEDVDGTFVGWHNRYRNTLNPGPNGVIDHIATDTTAPYSATWTLPEVANQTGVKFKIRVVDAAGNVVDAPGGPSAPFTLTRTHDTSVHTIPGFADNILWGGDGRFPATRTYTLTLPTGFDPASIERAYLLGSFWRNPTIAINANPAFPAFTSSEDSWSLSVRTVPAGQLKPGKNTITYGHNGGYGEFIEKPGPMLLLHYKNGTSGGGGGHDRGTHDHQPARGPVGDRGPDRDLQRHSHRHRTADLPVAAQRHEHHRRDHRLLHHPRHHTGRLRRHLPGEGQQQRRYGHQRRRHPDGRLAALVPSAGPAERRRVVRRPVGSPSAARRVGIGQRAQRRPRRARTSTSRRCSARPGWRARWRPTGSCSWRWTARAAWSMATYRCSSTRSPPDRHAGR